MNPNEPFGIPDSGFNSQNAPAVSKRHPLFGRLKGTVQVAPGVDLTEPADPAWADRLDEEYDPAIIHDDIV
jgi:hypothetical protein